MSSKTTYAHTSPDSEDWLDIWVFFDPETATLEPRLPPGPIPAGQPVRWRFRSRGPNDRAGPLPEGWMPMLAFSPETSPGAYGPFESLLQIAEEDRAGRVDLDVVGEWPEGDVAGSAGEFSYFAVLHRGIGFGGGKAFSLISTPRLSLRVGAPGKGSYERPTPPEGPSVELEVRRHPESDERLEIVPASAQQAFTNSTAHWRFGEGFERSYPLILFYHFKEKTGDVGSAVIEEGETNRYFEPCRRMRLHGSGVEAWDFKAGLRRHCFYEAAAVSTRVLSLRFASTGDPQIDNEGIAFPTDDV